MSEGMQSDSAIMPKTIDDSRVGRRKRSYIWDLLAPAVIPLAFFVTFLKHHDYGLFRPESLLCISGFVTFGMLLGFITMHAGRLVRSLVLASLPFLFIDFSVSWTPAEVGLLLLGVVAAGYLLARNLPLVASAIFGGALISTLALPPRNSGVAIFVSSREGPTQKDLPIVVHLILDEHIGLAGIPSTVALGTETGQFLRDMYLGHGFRVLPSAYSRYRITSESIANMMNFASEPRKGSFVGSSEPYRLIQNTYFQEMSQKGYGLHVYQSQYMDFCATRGIRFERCLTYPSNSINSIKSFGLGTLDSAWIISSSFLENGDGYRRLRKGYGRLNEYLSGLGFYALPRWSWERALVSPIISMDVLDRLIEDLKQAQRGDLYFAHLLLPHYPFVYDADCRLKPVANWMNRRRGSWDSRYSAYFEQVRCTTRRIGELLTSLEANPLSDDATIIVHGDHGSRLGDADFEKTSIGSWSSRDLVDFFSTFFAARGPDVEPGLDVRTLALQDLLQAIVFGEQALKSRHSETEPFVYVDIEGDEMWRPMPFPRFDN